MIASVLFVFAFVQDYPGAELEIFYKQMTPEKCRAQVERMEAHRKANDRWAKSYRYFAAECVPSQGKDS